MKSLSSLVKGMRVLGSFTIDTPEWGVPRICKSSGLSAIDRTDDILRTLTDAGLLMQTENRRYRLG